MTSTGESPSEATEEPQSEAAGESQSDATGESQADATGESQADATGESQADATGDSQALEPQSDPEVLNTAIEIDREDIAEVQAVPAVAVSEVRRDRRRPALVAATLGLLLGSVVAAASVYWWLYRPDQLTSQAVQQQVVSAAKEGIEAALSYSPENLDNDLANAKSHLTGTFLDYYSDFTKNVVTPAARDKGVKTEANVARAAVSDMRPNTADVLVFVNQVTTSKSRPTPALATSTVLVTMVKDGDRWLISEFNPV